MVPTEHWYLRNMSIRTRRIILIAFLTFLALATVIAFGAYQFYRFIYQTPLRIDNAGYVVMITPGMPVKTVANTLSEAGIMEHPDWFLGWMQWTGARTRVKAGEYLIKPGTTPQGLSDLLVSGKVIQHTLTIVEGWTFEHMMQALNNEPAIAHTLQGMSNEEIMKKIGKEGEHPEGRFFPETYCFPINTSDVTFLQRAYRMMDEKLNSLWATREQSLFLKSPYEALVLASIIEKESSFTDEYPEIAGVYVRRLQRKMPLQADPTIIYGLGKDYPGRLTYDHLKQPSPYNTYLNAGLPPTPIALPSLKALEAAVHPKPGSTLYFVASGRDKRHVFSESHDDHQKAVIQYRAIKAQKNSEAVKPEEVKPAEGTPVNPVSDTPLPQTVPAGSVPGTQNTSTQETKSVPNTQ